MKVILMFFSIGLSLFSCARESTYEVIAPQVRFFEFNAQRDKIYYYDFDNTLSVFDIENRTTTIIETELSAETMYFESTLFSSEDGYMYFISEDSILRIEGREIISRIPIIFREYHYGAVNSETIAFEKNEMKKINKIIRDYEDGNVELYFGNFRKNPDNNLIILNYADRSRIAFFARRLHERNYMEIENKEKIERLQKPVYFRCDPTFAREKLKKGAMNYFEDRRISIREKAYSCRRKSLMSLVSQCKYALYLHFNGKVRKLKDTSRKARVSLIDGNNVNVDLIEKLPNSRYISDKYGDLYLIFSEEDLLIKIPKSQFD